MRVEVLPKSPRFKNAVLANEAGHSSDVLQEQQMQ